ncbi:acetyl-CoA carboxylase, carboxyltransferase component [Moorella thermoacetica Y72]|uniref:Acetyl-CoA carboxylase, carboxyltransferase component n=1 Tax=Moorella thermoacetica Y72 TaxID=1325331 RepID=A0A0S6UG29_NEOTH|nr:carboxyl transferase domain-containing protein [Moorella thermoacetica]GAF26920.1 acetyl-CoA carboxylase, carboxyltransferase component [Moorella thermoacetica Y72]
MEDITARLADLEVRRARVMAGGGEERVARQHAAGKLTARERLELLLDPGSFLELDQFVRHRATDFGMQDIETPGEGVVTGSGTINGRPVYVYAQDFTVMGGSLGEMHAAKICKVMDLALKTGVPVIGLNDSGGARIQEGVAALNGYGEIFRRNTHASGVIPQIAAIMGPCAGGAVYSPGLMDFIFMVDNTAQMFITGPQVIKAVTGEEVSAEELGGAVTHATRSGVAHFRTPTEEDCLHLIRTLLDYLPANNLEDPPFRPSSDPAERQNPNLAALVPVDPNKPYNVKEIIYGVVDDGLFLEIQGEYAANMVIGLARLAGYTIGIVANQPQYLAGCLDINAADKAARFVRFCDAFNIPLLTLVDTPGYLPGVEQEQGGIIRHGAKLLYAFAEATVPKLTLVLRKAYGGAYLAMCSRSLGADHVVAWPTAEIAVMGPDGAANIIFRQEINQAEDPARVRQEKVAAYRDKFANPYVAAGLGLVDAVIDPALTRPHLIRNLLTLLSKRESRPGKKHGNFPV